MYCQYWKVRQMQYIRSPIFSRAWSKSFFAGCHGFSQKIETTEWFCSSPCLVFVSQQGAKRVPGTAVTKSVVATEPGGKKREEVFVDIIEKISVTFNASVSLWKGSFNQFGSSLWSVGFGSINLFCFSVCLIDWAVVMCVFWIAGIYSDLRNWRHNSDEKLSLWQPWNSCSIEWRLEHSPQWGEPIW